MNTNQGAGTLTAIIGIRFLSMNWVMLGHSYGFDGTVSGKLKYFIIMLKIYMVVEVYEISSNLLEKIMSTVIARFFFSCQIFVIDVKAKY